jgi:hypothetical protein
MSEASLLGPALVTASGTIMGAALGAAVAHFLAKRRIRATSNALQCAVLPDRIALYKKATELIQTGKVVLDTTWGPDAPEPTKAEREAMSVYLEARREFVRRRNQYRELFTITEQRAERIANSAREAVGTTYSVRHLEGFPKVKPIVDFMVVDSEHVLLSHVRSDRLAEYRFVYLRCPQVGQLLTKWFEDCWIKAKEVEPNR